MVTERYDTPTEEPDVNRLILNFIERMEARNEGLPYKSEERISIDSAVWYIDAALNLTYAQANYPFSQAQWDTVYAEMPVLAGNEVNISDVFDTYDVTLRGLSEKYHSIEEENKQFMMALVEDMGAVGGNKHKVRLIAITGTGVFKFGGDFGELENYRFEDFAEDDCFGETIDTNAPEMFEIVLYQHYNPDPVDNCRWYFFGATCTLFLDYVQHQINATLVNYLDYKIFAASQAVAPFDNWTECLEYDYNNSGIHEMQFYYDYKKELIDEWVSLSSLNPENKRFAGSIIKSRDEVNNYDYREIWHEPTIFFRKRGEICVHEQPIPEPPID